MADPNRTALAPCRTCGRSYAADVLACPGDGEILPLEGRLLDGKFSLDRKIGDGGMASVWQATNIRVARTVAIKLMHARFAHDPELLTRFRNEAAAAGKIDSDHICDVLDFGESPIGPYIVMELLEGCSLAELIAQHRRLDPGLAVWIARQALAGLAAAHRAGIVHRDLKPENIHLCRAIRGQWTIKLMDFGISKFAQNPNTAAGATLGTPHYMAPEQIQGAATVDARADLWAVGVILYESMTGVQVFARDTIAAALAALRTFDPPPLTKYLPAAPRGLAEIVDRCLVRAPEKRWASADALASALAPFERMDPKTAENAAKATTERRAAGGAPRALAQLQQPAARAPVQQPARPSGSAKPGSGDRSAPGGMPASQRVGRLPQPGSQRSGAQPSVAPMQLSPQPVVKPVAVIKPVVKPGGPVAKPAAAQPAKSAAKPAAKSVAPAKPAAAGRGAPAPRRGASAPVADQALLIGVLLAVFFGVVALAVVLALK